MVGVARSKGCRACVKQRVKCDEVKPACGRCIRFGRECPGYAKPAKFVYEIPRTKEEQKEGQGAFHHVRELDRPTAKNQRQSSSPIPSVPTSENVPAWNSAVTTSRSKPVWNSTFCMTQSFVPSSIISQTEGHNQALMVLIADSTPVDDYVDYHFMREWLTFIPPRLGINKALDDAVQCMGSHYIGTISKQDILIVSAQRAYGHALSSLRAAINDPVEGMSSETLAATMLLSLYELFACTKANAWVKHAGGAGQLIRVRGPNRLNTPFDRSMLIYFRGQMVMEAFMEGKPSFLCEPEWHFVLSDPMPQHPSSFVCLSNEFYTHLAAAPGIVAAFYALDRANIPAVVSYLNSVSNLATGLRTWFIHLREALPGPTEVRAYPPDPLFPTVYRYRGNPNVYFTTSYHGCLILLNTLTNELQPDDSLVVENKFFVDEICKSIDFSTRSGLLGPYGVIFALKMAFMVAEPPIKAWLQQYIRNMGKVIPFLRQPGLLETSA